MILVTIALLPLGAIAVWQTDRILKKEQATARAALIAITEKAAARERQSIERAIGAAEAVGRAAHRLAGTGIECAALLRGIGSGDHGLADARFVSTDGNPGCGDGSGLGQPPSPELQRLMAEARLGLHLDPATGDGQPSRLVVAAPAFDGGHHVGHMVLRLPVMRFEPPADRAPGEFPQGLVTLNDAGDILMSEQQHAEAAALLPADIPLSGLLSDRDYTFAATARDGQERLYAVVSLVPGVAYALGTWDADTPLIPGKGPYWRTILLAVLMWMASLAVVYLIMRLEVINGVRVLHAEVRAFREKRTLPRSAHIGRGELLELEEGFRDLTETIIREEAELENALHEKNVLLKEVHHRVKNNLQLINSILNMLLRRAQTDETRKVVARLRERILALATVHRAVYKAQSVDRIDAGEILREITARTKGSERIPVRLHLAPVALRPDQVLPLALLVSEAVTDAIDAGAAGPRGIDISLAPEPAAAAGPRITRLHIQHETGDSPQCDGTGFGLHLMQAFAHQLDSTLTLSQAAGQTHLVILFETDDLESVAEADPVMLAAQ